MELIGYHGRVFEPVGYAGAGTPPQGRYSQYDDLVWAEFSGPGLRAGRLVGRRGAGGVIDAAYCQVMADGEVVAGRCTSTPTVLADGRVRLTERWERHDGTRGVSQIEEVAR